MVGERSQYPYPIRVGRRGGGVKFLEQPECTETPEVVVVVVVVVGVPHRWRCCGRREVEEEEEEDGEKSST